MRDNFDDQPFDAPETVRSYIDMFAAPRRSRKPHYLLTPGRGSWTGRWWRNCAQRGIAVVGGLREGLSAIDRLARLASRANS